jgi:probable ribonuclease FAU-1
MSRRSQHGRPARPNRPLRTPAERGAALTPGAMVAIVHGKPWKRTITMRGTVRSWDGALLIVERSFSAGGQYDSLNVPKLAGDWGTIEVAQGSRVLRRAYYRQDGALIGELFNIQTPAEIADGMVRYVDLEVDVVRMPDGRVAVVDEEDLASAVRVGGVDPETAEAARALAHRLAAILRADGDWQTADAERPG